MMLKTYITMLMVLNLVTALLGMSFFSLLERKILSYMQIRKGPNKNLFMGLIQPFLDGMKLMTKSKLHTVKKNTLMFYISPLAGLAIAFTLWSSLIHTKINTTSYMTFSMMFILMIMTMNVFPPFLAGWFSNTKYSSIGAIRSISQVISYEVTFITIFLMLFLYFFTTDMQKMETMSFMPLMMALSMSFLIWTISSVAETNRAPFDFAEGESEIVSGFNIEYSSWLFAMLFMSEFMSILFLCMMSTILFINNSSNLIMTTTLLTMMILIFLFMRGSYPRTRYDQMMMFNWKFLLIFSMIYLMIMIMF